MLLSPSAGDSWQYIVPNFVFGKFDRNEKWEREGGREMNTQCTLASSA